NAEADVRESFLVDRDEVELLHEFRVVRPIDPQKDSGRGHVRRLVRHVLDRVEAQLPNSFAERVRAAAGSEAQRAQSESDAQRARGRKAHESFLRSFSSRVTTKSRSQGLVRGGRLGEGILLRLGRSRPRVPPRRRAYENPRRRRSTSAPLAPLRPIHLVLGAEEDSGSAPWLFR